MRNTRIVLSLLALCVLGLATLHVPRLVNCLWSDAEFTGWVTPIAARIAAGESIYADFTLPIPPASFLVLAAIQRLLGRAALIDELWLIAACQFGMVLVGFWLVRQLTSTRVALLAAICSAPMLTSTPKEIAYDQTAQLVAWAGLGLLCQGLLAREARPRGRWLLAAGFVTGLSLAFKSSTGLGAIGGAITALAYLTLLTWRRQGRSAMGELRTDWTRLGGGLAAGLLATAAVVLSAGGSLGEFIQIVFVDGPALKGGAARALGNLLSYVVFQHPMQISLLTAGLLALLLSRVIGRSQVLSMSTADGPEAEAEQASPSVLFTVLASGLLVLAYGLGAFLLLSNAENVPLALRIAEKFANVPRMAGLLFIVVFLIANLRHGRAASDRSAVFVAVVLAAGAQSLMHNLSWPEVRPYYDNNPIIPLAIGILFVGLDRAKAPLMKWACVGLLLLTLFGPKFQRYLDARNPVAEAGLWQGMRVSGNGLTVLRVAQRVRELTAADDEVLVLPEDPMVAALIGRPRPRLFGAIVFVDQYPEHAFVRDMPTLRGALPKVLVLHPRERGNWRGLYERWNRSSPAGRLQDEFLAAHLAGQYRLDSSYPSWYFTRRSTLDVYVRTP